MEKPTKESVCEENNFNSIYREHVRPLRNFIYYRCGNIAKAEDFAQEALISLWENCIKVSIEKSKSFL
jgi:RNA polymerase sigma-70 factor (ECF subfamily)